MIEQIENTQLTQNKSPLKAWFVTKFQVKRVFSIRATPAINLFSIIVYSRCWVLIAS